MPMVGVSIGFGVPWIKKLLDSKFTSNPYVTKSTTLSKYKSIYGGPDYLVHFKYSEMLNILFVSMLYGLGMPLLFPISGLALFMAYVCERISLAYITRQPPAMDDSLTKTALSMARFAPLLMLINGYWMLSNQQIFANVWSYKQHDLQPMFSSHKVWPISVTWATPLLYMVVTGLLLTIASVMFNNHLKAWGFSMQRTDIEVDEDLPNFWTAVKFSQAQEVVKEFDNMKEGYMVEIEDPRVIEILSGITTMPKRAIQRTPWYNILSNQTYNEAFYYIGAHIGEREKLIKDADENDDNNCEQSDIVNLLLNLGNIPDEVAQKFNFTPGFQPDFKK